ncbi:MAG: hypothetical protein KKF30_12215 [Proteobacteria bacterium]|nr:hypothetical protein [Pseudomonadota bacterium]MBU4469444.1 hypothetical protein [Pseudomonadota bacterium]MCG2752345.1 hypothetical protein [Desulfobacteraceae bacterium]
MNAENEFGNDEDDDLIIELTDVVEVRTEVNEFDDLGKDMEDLGTLVSEITGHKVLSDMSPEGPDLAEWSSLSPGRLDAAVEKAVDKLFQDKIEARIMALFEAAVKKEIDKISELIRDQTRKPG